MSAQKYDVSSIRLAEVDALKGTATLYDKLFMMYNEKWKQGKCFKNSTHDSIFFIIKGALGFRVIKFYNDSKEFRIGGHHEHSSDAYNEGVHSL